MSFKSSGASPTTRSTRPTWSPNSTRPRLSRITRDRCPCDTRCRDGSRTAIRPRTRLVRRRPARREAAAGSSAAATVGSAARPSTPASWSLATCSSPWRGERTDGNVVPCRRRRRRCRRHPRFPRPRPRHGRAGPRHARRRDPDRGFPTPRTPCTRWPRPGARGSARSSWGSSMGSIAKTSTKETVVGALAGRFRTLRTEGNQNNEAGLPISVLRLGPRGRRGRPRMGMYVAGEIRGWPRSPGPPSGSCCRPSRPPRADGSMELIDAAKAELVEALPAPPRGWPSSTPTTSGWPDGGGPRPGSGPRRARRPPMSPRGGRDRRAPGCGSGGGARGERETANPRSEAPGPHRPGRDRRRARGDDLDEVAAALESASTSMAPHRSATRGPTDDGPRRTYNASPGSVRAALDFLVGPPGRRVAVLGEMRELGDAGGVSIVRSAPRRGAGPGLVAVGPGRGSGGISEAARAAGMARTDLVARDARTRRGCSGPRRGSATSSWSRPPAGSTSTRRGRPGRAAGDASRRHDPRADPGPPPRLRVVAILMPPYIRLLRHLGFAKQIRAEVRRATWSRRGRRRWAAS